MICILLLDAQTSALYCMNSWSRFRYIWVFLVQFLQYRSLTFSLGSDDLGTKQTNYHSPLLHTQHLRRGKV